MAKPGFTERLQVMLVVEPMRASALSATLGALTSQWDLPKYTRCSFSLLLAEHPLRALTPVTTELAQLNMWLKRISALGPLEPLASEAIAEALLVACLRTRWDALAQRHIVLLCASAPTPLNTHGTTQPHGSSIWSPLPEELASAGISLSVLSTYSNPRLEHLQLCCDAARGLPTLMQRATATPTTPVSLLSDGLAAQGA